MLTSFFSREENVSVIYTNIEILAVNLVLVPTGVIVDYAVQNTDKRGVTE